MYKRRGMVFLLIMILVFGMTACASQKEKQPAESKPATGNETEDDGMEETILDPQMAMEQNMIENSLLAQGNNYRLKKVIEKARNGEDVTLGFIGGSITYGYNSGTTENFAKLVTDFFAKEYGTGENVHCVNAGLSGTPSLLGLIRSDKELFPAKPDVVFIEFSVNDGDLNGDFTGYESLVRKCLMQDNAPAVILLFSIIESGYTMQNDHNLTRFYYDLTGISMKNAIWSYLEDGTIRWKDWSKDESHPNEWGQSMYAKFIIHAIQLADAAQWDEEYVIPEKMNKGFDHTALIPVDNAQNPETIRDVEYGSFAIGTKHENFPDGWMHESGSEPMTFTYEGCALYLVYRNTNSNQYGTAEVYVDGERCMTLDGNTPGGWYNPVPVRITRAKESGLHSVEIRMAEDSENLKFEVLCLGIVP